ncbi:MAG: hypothetical protein WCY36_07390 [Candidatus Omnitrophota bacterium]
MDKITYTEAKKQYGTATLNGLTVALTEQAVADNYGTNPTRVCYYASAIDRKGRRYTVRWETTTDWDEAVEAGYLEAQDDLTGDDQARLDILRDKCLPDCGDEGNACDWDNPVTITLI